MITLKSAAAPNDVAVGALDLFYQSFPETHLPNLNFPESNVPLLTNTNISMIITQILIRSEGHIMLIYKDPG